MAKKTKKSLDGRHRDTTGRIDKKHGNTRVKALRKTYGEHFAKGRRGDMMLKTLLAETARSRFTPICASITSNLDAGPIPRPVRATIIHAIRHPGFICRLFAARNHLARSTRTDRERLRGRALAASATHLSEAPWGGSRPSGCCGR